MCKMDQELIEKFKNIRRMLNLIKYFRKNGMDYPIGPLSLYKSEEDKKLVEKKLTEEFKGLEQKCIEKNIPKELMFA